MYISALFTLFLLGPASCWAAPAPLVDKQQHPLSRHSSTPAAVKDAALDSDLFYNGVLPPGVPGVSSDWRIPTSRESAVLARRILRLARLGTLTTVYPPEHNSGLGGVPVGLMEYVADCERGPDGEGNPTLLAVDIATPYVNYRAGSNISLALQWTPPPTPQQPYPFSAASLPRFALLGRLEDVADTVQLEACFLRAHPDARWWLPGRRGSPHATRFMRLAVTHVYWVGGFGDQAYIGWIPAEEWAGVGEEEIDGVRLPGERE